ncbi:MAG: ATP-binding protein, partial [Flavipsychrobacter sp.]|nr:ATP-binding protein [Flavipsychrobacter sp.]
FYLRSLVGMANNKGGQIVFGIKDSPHIPAGMKNDKLQTCDPADINQKMTEYFSHDFDWHIDIMEFDGKTFGRLWVPEAGSKPIICKKMNEKCRLREGAIYYRYRGETKEIAYTELVKLIEKEKEKEKLLWMEHIQKISSIGPKNAHVLDAYKGEMEIGKAKILVDKELLKQMKFVREGMFVEKDGAPTLVVRGEISGVTDASHVVATDDLYPLFTKNLQEELSLNSYQIKCLIWKLNIKGDKRYHNSFKSGATNEIHKYSRRVLDILKRFLSNKDYLINCVEEYSKTFPNTGRKRTKK